MNFNFVSKNNIGAVSTLVFIIMLSQSRIFDFLIDTVLGRAFLILFILGISCTHKILGVVAVLFVIIMFNQSSLGQLEGFTSSGADNAKAQAQSQTQDKDKEDKAKAKMNDGHEGFNTIDRESAILKGKKSSEIPVVSNARNQHDDVEPADKTAFTSFYSSVF
jgi:hypothetical protein